MLLMLLAIAVVVAAVNVDDDNDIANVLLRNLFYFLEVFLRLLLILECGGCFASHMLCVLRRNIQRQQQQQHEKQQQH